MTSSPTSPGSTPAIPFTVHAHGREAERRHDVGWLEAEWNSPTTRVAVVTGDQVVRYRRPGGRMAETDWWTDPGRAPDGERYLLGVDAEGRARFAVHAGSDDSQETVGLREVAAVALPEDAGWLCHAVALAQWHATHTHCPRCGTPTVVVGAGSTRRCPADESLHFPRVDPAVIVLVTDDADRALLGRQAAWPQGRFSTLAGFVEPGESAEHAVAREVAEESGVRVTDVRLLASQPWPFPSSLMLGAVASARRGSIPRADGDELAEARWFSRPELRDEVAAGRVQVPGPISISRWLIDRWYGGELPDDRAGWR